MANNFNQDFHEASSDSDVQEIEPPVFVRRRKRRRRLLREPIYRCSQRNKKGNDNTTNNSELAPSPGTTVHQDQNIVRDSLASIILVTCPYQ
jgi:hypothetical protein